MSKITGRIYCEPPDMYTVRQERIMSVITYVVGYPWHIDIKLKEGIISTLAVRDRLAYYEQK